MCVFTQALGGALVKRADLVARITYTERQSESGEALYTLYQEPSLKVNGIINTANGVQINTRPKEWTICLKPKDWEEQQLQRKLENATETERAEAKRKYYEKLGFNEEAIALLGELAPPWTCVSNCTGLKNNQISEEARNCLRNELITMRGRVWHIVFDPPHLIRGGGNSWLVKKYGKLPSNWQDVLKKGFDECMRVLKPNGTLIFKWNETQIPVSEILKVIEYQPIYGHKSGRLNKTHWMAFVKIEDK